MLRRLLGALFAVLLIAQSAFAQVMKLHPAIGNVVPPSAAIWDAGFIGPDLTLLTTTSFYRNTNTGSWELVRSVTSHASSKWCVDIQPIGGASTPSVTQAVAGIGTSALTVNDFVGSNSTSWGWVNQGGAVFNNNSSIPTNPGDWFNSSSSKLRLAVDIDAGKLWFYNDNTAQWNGDVIGNQNPAMGVGGIGIMANLTYYIFGGALSVTGTTSGWTADFTATAAACPSGFTAWG